MTHEIKCLYAKPRVDSWLMSLIKHALKIGTLTDDQADTLINNPVEAKKWADKDYDA